MWVSEIVRGDDFILEYNITKAYDANGNRLTSLSGLSWRFQARLSPADGTVLFEKSSDAGTITVNGWLVRVFISSDDTASLAGKHIWCDLEATDASGHNVTVFIGDSPYVVLNVLQDVTR